MKFSSFKVEFFNLGGVKILSEVNFMHPDQITLSDLLQVSLYGESAKAY